MEERSTGQGSCIRGLSAEYGLVVGRHVHTLRRVLPYLVEDAENGLSFDSRGLLEDLRQDLAGQVG